MTYTSRFEYDQNTSANNESIEMAISGETQSEHDMRLRKAKNDLLDSWDEFADSPANNYREWRGKEEPFLWKDFAWGFGLMLVAGLLCWLAWQGYGLVEFLAGW